MSNCSDWGRKRRDFVSLTAYRLHQLLMMMMMTVMGIRRLLLLLLTFLATTTGETAGRNEQVSTRKYLALFNFFYKLVLLFIHSVLIKYAPLTEVTSLLQITIIIIVIIMFIYLTLNNHVGWI